MMRLVFVLTVVWCLADYGLEADTLTNGEALARARQIALQLPTRECLLQVAKACRQSDPAQALKDYQAAAAKPCPRNWSSGKSAESSFEIAEAISQLGNAELAKKLLETICDGLLAAEPPAGVAGPWYRNQAFALLRVAQDLFTLDRPRFEQALLKAQEYLTQQPQDAGSGQLLQRALTVLALKEPETAIQRYKAELGNWGFTTDIVWNALQADPVVVLAHVDDIMPRGRSLSGSPNGPSEGQVKGQLLSFVFRRDPAQAQQLAERLGLFFQGDERGRLWLALAETMREIGIAKLPPVVAYPRLYAAALPDLAPLDYDLAMQFARALPDPAGRCAGLVAISRRLLASDPEHALAAAREALACFDANPHLNQVSLARLASTLADTDANLTPQLLKRLTLPWALAQAFPRWWAGHPSEAEALLPSLTPAQQLHCLAGLLTLREKVLTVAERRAWVQRATALPAFGQEVDSTRQIVMVTAGFDPDLARQQWPLLKPGLISSPPEEMTDHYLEVLYAIAEALEQRQPGSAAAEMAEITTRLTAAPVDRSWPYLYRLRLARLHGRTDRARCGAVVAEVIASLTAAPKRVSRQALLAEAIQTLSTIDLPAALKLFGEQKEVQGNWMLFQNLMVAQAEADPKAVIPTICQLASKPSLNNTLSDVMYRVAQECPEECVKEVAVSWLQTTPRAGNPLPQVLLAILRSGRPDLIAHVPEYLDLMPQDFSLAAACNLHDLVFASDEVLTAIRTRLQALKPYETRDAVGKVLAARLERDWSVNQDQFNAFSPSDQCQALLMMREMRLHRERMAPEAR